MDTSIVLSQGRRRRRIHSAEFKAHIVAACSKPEVSSAAVAMANGINANLVRSWVKEAEIGTEVNPGSTAGQLEKTKAAAPPAPKFLPLSLPNLASAPVANGIRIELQRGAMTVTVSWPVDAVDGVRQG